MYWCCIVLDGRTVDIVLFLLIGLVLAFDMQPGKVERSLEMPFSKLPLELHLFGPFHFVTILPHKVLVSIPQSL
jgi:hypothetical protein